MTLHTIRRPALTDADADALGRELSVLRAAAAPDLALDLAAVESVAPAALARFVVVGWEVRACGGRVSVVNLRPAVHRVFVQAGLDGVLDVRPAGDARSGRRDAA